MQEVTFIIGLPGSGKSTLIEYYKSHPFVNYKVYDDWMICTLDEFPEKDFNTECNYSSLIQDISNNIPILITGIDFCNNTFLSKAEYYLKSEFPNIKINRIYFENDFEKCKSNIEYRDKQRGGYWEENEKGEMWYYGTIYELKPLYLQEIERAENLSKNYIIPEGYQALPIIVQS